MTDELDENIDIDSDADMPLLGSMTPHAIDAGVVEGDAARRQANTKLNDGISTGVFVSLAPEPTWIIDPKWTANTDMDDESRVLIERMLEEEEFYAQPKASRQTSKRQQIEDDAEFGSADEIDTKPASPKRPRKSSTSTKLKLPSQPKSKSSDDHDEHHVSNRSSSHLPSHNTRWTTEEEDLLMDGLKRKGFGNWKAIAAIVGTRNPLQVKNHARQLVQSGKLPASYTEQRSSSPEAKPSPPKRPSNVKRKDKVKTEDEAVQNVVIKAENAQNTGEDDEEIDIGSDDDRPRVVNSANPAAVTQEETEIAQDPELNKDQTNEVSSTQIAEDAQEEIEKEAIMDMFTNDHLASENVLETNGADVIDGDVDADNGHVHQDESLLDEEPLEEKILDLSVISDEEKDGNREFFIGSSTKTPDRYVKIRNHIISLWQESRPAYFTKTKARQGLKDCGDVNVIGRVYDFLERKGVINFGSQRPKMRKSNVRRSLEGAGSESDDVNEALPNDGDGLRRRRMRAQSGVRTIMHLAQSELDEAIEQQRLDAMNARYFDQSEIVDFDILPRNKRASYYLKEQRRHGNGNGNSDGFAYDPFRLIHPHRYSSTHQAPFQVLIHSNCLLMMDFHCHLAQTEVIGLLGGTFDSHANQLTVQSVFPCNSISTGIQCEMDPVSETAARDAFNVNGHITVGWYHSHPTFAPNPSVRDIENQTSYQTLFRTDHGIEPFIGMIVSPYDTRYPSNSSFVQILSVEHQHDSTLRRPMLCDKTIIQDGAVPDQLITALSDLYDKYRNSPDRVNWDELYRKGETLTKRDKLLESLTSQTILADDQREQFLEKMRMLLQ